MLLRYKEITKHSWEIIFKYQQFHKNVAPQHLFYTNTQKKKKKKKKKINSETELQARTVEIFFLLGRCHSFQSEWMAYQLLMDYLMPQFDLFVNVWLQS